MMIDSISLGDTIDLKLILPKSTQHGCAIIVRDKDNESLEITYKKKHASTPKPFTLPKRTIIDNWSLEVAGLEQGELTKKLRFAK